MKTPADLKYTKNDEWVRIEGDEAVIGITDYAQDQLSDIVFVEIVAFEGDSLNQGETCAVVESVKAASDIYMPISGEITAINEALADSPELINEDPFGDAWLLRIKMSKSSELEDLLDAEAYKNLERDH
ncbi:MAG TPA: glycine cleavage system protein GcvH [Chloroflexi bacterium]|nr:MAG: glycine cleavage system protein GcvH [Chloroflexota bacterium]HDD56070.1 glycine cleavage system protein GcvH [Chloroflexota bacterium]